ncbi:DUF1837 domain-containing protein [Brucella sp. BE17]|uniref:HamA C-terminal domain-containing protein n=1 Tax=Brucella sp. BE17 TaxID=3142977 RepID=UPI0031BA6FCB
MSVYAVKPERFLEDLGSGTAVDVASHLYCAGFDGAKWRCDKFAFHLAEWLPDYALREDELAVHHGNSLLKHNQAAIRVYTSSKYENRGEVGEIALHAICRDFFETVPISPRVFYKSASNDVIKAFDMVHARFPENGELEIWLGESKIYQKGARAIADAIGSVRKHIEAGFLENEKILLGPQIPKSTPNYEKLSQLFKKNAKLDDFLSAAVFPIGIMCESPAAAIATKADAVYLAAAKAELDALSSAVAKSDLIKKIRLEIIYIPVPKKSDIIKAFDKRLKGLQ